MTTAPEAATETPSTEAPESVETSPPTPPKTKRAATRAQETSTRMSDESGKGGTSIPAELVQQLAQLEALRVENAKFKAAEEQRAKAEEARAKTDEETKSALAKLQEQIQLTERDKAKLAEENRATKITNAVRLAAMAAGAVDADDVTALLSGKFTLAEDGSVITADDTKAKVGDAVKGFLEKKPHLLGRKVAGGSGASPFPAQSAPNAPTYDMSNPADINRAFHDRLRAAAQPASTGSK